MTRKNAHGYLDLAHHSNRKTHAMNKLISLVSLTLLAGCMTPISAQTVRGERPIVFEAQTGETVEAFEGSLVVPENRAATDSRSLTLKYVRFPATGETQGAPIIYLSGGPGGSGIQTAKNNRFPLFMAMREFGDVIAFDQRGTGASNDLPNCTSSEHISTTEPTTDAVYFETQRRAFAECLAFWKEEGLDVHGYSTKESVSDLNDLRQHLGAEKINLWGISYGSHLSLAVRDVATAAGAVIGGVIGHENSRKHYGNHSSGYYKTVQYCDTTHNTRYEEKVVDYKVTYKYKGQIYKTRTKYHPGERLKVRVNVAPY